MKKGKSTTGFGPSEQQDLRTTQERRSIFDNIFDTTHARVQLALLAPENNQILIKRVRELYPK